MKYPNVLTKRQFNAAVLDSLFNPVEGYSLAAMPKKRFSLGKYKPGRVAGQPVPEHMHNSVLVVWVERRRDSDGPYDALFSISKPR